MAVLSKLLGFLSGPLSWLIGPILDWLQKVIVARVKIYLENKKSDKKIDDHAAQASEEMKNAKSQEELDRADRDLLS